MKKPTPKRQACHSQTSRRYKAFKNFAQKRLAGSLHLTQCPHCLEAKLQHSACPACGKYEKRQVLNMEKKVDKITKVKA